MVNISLAHTKINHISITISKRRQQPQVETPHLYYDKSLTLTKKYKFTNLANRTTGQVLRKFTNVRGPQENDIKLE